MRLKRHYAKPEGWQPKWNRPDAKGQLPNPHRAAGVLLNPPPLEHIQLQHTGTTPEQNFSVGLVEKGQEEGWIAIKDGQLILYGLPENLIYDIKRFPGRYSCFDGIKLPDDEDDSGKLARAYLAEHHPGEASPDPENPAGYYKLNSYECVLSAGQHAKFCAKTETQRKEDLYLAMGLKPKRKGVARG